MYVYANNSTTYMDLYQMYIRILYVHIYIFIQYI